MVLLVELLPSTWMLKSCFPGDNEHKSHLQTAAEHLNGIHLSPGRDQRGYQTLSRALRGRRNQMGGPWAGGG